jgi:hypothetical protein
VLLVLVAVFTLAIVLSNPDVYELSLFRVLIPVTSAGVYLTGVGAAVLILVALALLRAGLRRRRVRRLEQKSAATAPAQPVRHPGPGRPGSVPPPGRTSTLDLDRPPPPAANDRRCSTKRTGSVPMTPRNELLRDLRPGMRHLREEKDRQKMLVVSPKHGGGAPAGHRSGRRHRRDASFRPRRPAQNRRPRPEGRVS